MLTDAEREVLNAIDGLGKDILTGLREIADKLDGGKTDAPEGDSEGLTREFYRRCEIHEDCRGCRLFDVCSACPDGESIHGVIMDGDRDELMRVMINVLDGIRVQ